ncbi:hypothetical protein HZA98_00420 [Candidatus Woesearchaeota archaeon]|nr:hypothetical protein [Candidatus Woesearchaeota archaeon]
METSMIRNHQGIERTIRLSDADFDILFLENEKKEALDRLKKYYGIFSSIPNLSFEEGLGQYDERSITLMKGYGKALEEWQKYLETTHKRRRV